MRLSRFFAILAVYSFFITAVYAQAPTYTSGTSPAYSAPVVNPPAVTPRSVTDRVAAMAPPNYGLNLAAAIAAQNAAIENAGVPDAAPQGQPQPQQPPDPDLTAAIKRIEQMQKQSAENVPLTLSNCSGNGIGSVLSLSPTRTALSRALCRYENTGHPVTITDFQCTSLDNGFYKCFVSRGDGNGNNYKLRYTDGLWRIYGLLNG